MSRPDIYPGATETQQMRITAPVGVSFQPISHFSSDPISQNSSDSSSLNVRPLLICLFCTLPCIPGQRPATFTSIVFDGRETHPRSSRLFRISSRSDGIVKYADSFFFFSFALFHPFLTYWFSLLPLCQSHVAFVMYSRYTPFIRVPWGFILRFTRTCCKQNTHTTNKNTLNLSLRK
jgi:hypothetical protein